MDFLLFFGIIVFLGFIFRAEFVIRNKNSHYNYIESIPKTFVTLGLLFTFIGISIGLFNFNTEPDAIKESIKFLLNGLRTALFTSVIGIICSLVYGWRIKCLHISGKLVYPESLELEELRLLNANLTKSHQNSIEKLFGDVDGSITRNVEKLIDGNFDKLTSSIDSLIEWQERYRSDIVLLLTSYSSLVEKHSEFTRKTEDWVNSLEQISGQSSKLKKVVKDFNSAFSEDGNLYRIIQDIKDTTEELKGAATNFSTIAQKMDESTKSIQTTNQNVRDWAGYISKISDTSASIISQLETLKNFRVQDINGISEQFNKNISTTFGAFDELVQKYIENIEKRIRLNDK